MRRSKLVGRLLFYSAAVLLGLPLALSQVLIGTYRQPVGQPPEGYEEFWISSAGLRLRAWLAEGNGDRAAAVVVHGLGDTLESYVGVAEGLNHRGHSVLLLDLRGHGGSEGKRTTLGGLERDDVRAGIHALGERGLAEKGVLLWGVSMGAVAVLRAAAEESDVRAVVAEAPFDTYRETVAHHARLLFGLPSWIPLLPMTIRIAEWRAGFDADDVDSVAAARRIEAPLLAIVDGADRRMPEPVVRRIVDAHRGPKTLWVAPEAPHAGALYAPGYWEQLLGFFEENGL